jgi:hypothetical protein
MLGHGIKIHFAHRTFSWNNEGRGKAAVHCVIVGFGLGNVAEKTLFEAVAVVSKPVTPCRQRRLLHWSISG